MNLREAKEWARARVDKPLTSESRAEAKVMLVRILEYIREQYGAHPDVAPLLRDYDAGGTTFCQPDITDIIDAAQRIEMPECYEEPVEGRNPHQARYRK